MPEEHLEVERKYDVDGSTVVPDLSGLPGVGSVEQPTRSWLSATYFDTEGLRLLQSRITLRRRTGGDDEGWHLKLPAADTGRQEIRLRLDASSDEAVPSELYDRVRGQVGGRSLRPVARLRTRRTIRRLLAPDGRPLAELCDDEVAASTELSDDPTGGDAVELRWREWEAELVEGPGELLEALEPLLCGAGARPAAGPSKLGRVLAERLPPEPPSLDDIGTDSSTGELLHGYLAKYVRRLREQDLALRSGDQEGVHQMRIAARRLRSALATYRPVLDRALTDPVRDELRWLGTGLAEARDAQVIRGRLTERAAAQPAELVMGPVARRLESELDERFRTGRARALELLDTRRYLRLVDGLDDLAAAPPLTEDADRPAAELLPQLMGRDRKRVDARHKAWRRTSDPEAREVALHDVRKAAKRLRYGAESAQPVLGDVAGELASAAEDIQELLGELQDTVVARRALRELGVRAHLDGDNGFTFGLLSGLEQTRAEEIERRYPELRKRLP